MRQLHLIPKSNESFKLQLIMETDSLTADELIAIAVKINLSKSDFLDGLAGSKILKKNGILFGSSFTK